MIRFPEDLTIQSNSGTNRDKVTYDDIAMSFILYTFIMEGHSGADHPIPTRDWKLTIAGDLA